MYGGRYPSPSAIYINSAITSPRDHRVNTESAASRNECMFTTTYKQVSNFRFAKFMLNKNGYYSVKLYPGAVRNCINKDLSGEIIVPVTDALSKINSRSRWLYKNLFWLHSLGVFGKTWLIPKPCRLLPTPLCDWSKVMASFWSQIIRFPVWNAL